MMNASVPDRSPTRVSRSERKELAILDAAESLFVAEGYDRVSVDAIAAKAEVSKRTIYDHFSDKQTLFEKVLDRVHGALVVSIRDAIDTELSDERELREALVAFAIRVVAEAFPSADYVAFRRLTTQQRTLPPLPERTANQPERMLKERFAEMIRDARIAQSDPGVAAAHFTALTIRLALDELNADPTEPVERSDIISIIGNGVDAFLRAYGR